MWELLGLRDAAKRLWTAPFATAGILLSISVSVAAATTVFSWIDSILLNPFPAIERSGDLYVVAGRTPSGTLEPLSPPALADLRRSTPQFRSFAFTAVTLNPLNMADRTADSTRRVFAHFVSSNYFDALRIPVDHGPGFEPDHDADRDEPVAVISHQLWTQAFRNTRDLDRLRLDLNGRPARIVGVARHDFTGTVVGLSVDAWLPISNRRSLIPGAAPATDRESRWVVGLAAMHDGVSHGDVDARLAAVSADLRRAFPATDDRLATAIPISRSPWGAQGGTGPVLYLFAGLVTLLLVLSCANAANLVFVRTMGRRRDIAIRIAIGARRSAIVRDQIAEGFLLAAATTLSSLIAVRTLADLLLAFVPPTDNPFLLATGVSWRVTLFAAGLSVCAATISTTFPVFRVSGRTHLDVLRGGDGSGSGGGRSKELLVVAQVALSVAILAAGSLFFRSLQEARQLPVGFARDGVWLASYDLAQLGYSVPDGQAVHERVRREVASLPSVSGVSSATRVPLGFTPLPSKTVSVRGYVAQSGEDLSIGANLVGPDYFTVMEIALRSGREFSAEDSTGREPVVIINETMAARFWRDRDPIGDVITIDGVDTRIIGVAATGKYRMLSETPSPHLYLCINQEYAPRVTLHLRAVTTPAQLAADLRRLARTIDSGLTLSTQSMTEHLQFATLVARVSSSFLGMFGGLAVAIATLGLTTVLTAVFSSRRRELAIRQACGATPWSINRMILRYAGTLTVAGVVPGIALAGLTAQVARSLLVGVTPWDAAAYTAVVLLVAALSLAGAFVPIAMVERAPLSNVLKES